jgi:sulfur carrier protein ThiS
MRKVLRRIFLLALAGTILAPAFAAAQDDLRQASVAAATDSAVHHLLDQLIDQPIVPNLTVGDFLDKVGGREDLVAALGQIEPVGGARWLDDKTCQVRLEVTGTEVVVDLANIAVKHPGQSPIPAGDLPRVAVGLAQHWFAATGTSTAAGVAPLPPPGSPWNGVTPEQRRAAVHNADADAAGKVLASVSSIELTPGNTIGDALKEPGVSRAVGEWLGSRPVTAVDYQANAQGLTVQVTLAASGAELFDIFRAAVTARNDVPLPNGVAAWAIVRNQFLHDMAPSIGIASPPPAVAAAPLMIFAQPPDWANGMADAAGNGGPSSTSLRAARAAEADALAKLRQQVMALPLNPNLTIAQASEHDERLARAVDRAIARGGQLYKTEYHADGAVVARMSLDLRLVWSAVDESAAAGPGPAVGAGNNAVPARAPASDGVRLP